MGVIQRGPAGRSQHALLQDLRVRKSVCPLFYSKCLALWLSPSKNPTNICCIKEQMRQFRKSFFLNLRQGESRLRNNRGSLMQVKWGRLHRAERGLHLTMHLLPPLSFLLFLPRARPSITSLLILFPMSVILTVVLTFLSTGSLPLVQNHDQSNLCLKSYKTIPKPNK